jgi:hypothetical protein
MSVTTCPAPVVFDDARQPGERANVNHVPSESSLKRARNRFAAVSAFQGVR